MSCIWIIKPVEKLRAGLLCSIYALTNLQTISSQSRCQSVLYWLQYGMILQYDLMDQLDPILQQVKKLVLLDIYFINLDNN